MIEPSDQQPKKPRDFEWGWWPTRPKYESFWETYWGGATIIGGALLLLIVLRNAG